MTNTDGRKVPLDVLDRVLANTATPDDRARIAEILSEGNPSGDLPRLLDALRTNRGQYLPDAETTGRMFEILRTEANRDESAPRISPPRIQKLRHVPRWIARGLLIAACSAGFFLVARAPRETTNRAAPHNSQRSYTTTDGQVATITLTDGTHVTLAPRTTFSIGDDFGARTRDVAIDGEAYFDVAPASRAPFTVHTEDGAAVRVLGTSFDVSAYSGHETRVAVRTGRIHATASRGAAATVGAGTVACLTDSTVITATTDITPYTSWTSGSLVFDEAPITDVLAALSRWYGMEFRLADPTLARASLTARFSTKSSADAMALLKTAFRVTLSFDRVGDTTIVTLHSRTSQQPGTDTIRTLRDGHNMFSIHREIGR